MLSMMVTSSNSFGVASKLLYLYRSICVMDNLFKVMQYCMNGDSVCMLNILNSTALCSERVIYIKQQSIDRRSAKSLLHTSHYYIVDRNVDDFHEEANEAHHKEA